MTPLLSVPLLSESLPPPLQLDQLTATRFPLVPVILITVAAALYVWGVVRANRLHPRHPWPYGRLLAFLAGLATTGAAVFSFVGIYDWVFFWDHMVQHLMLIMIAAAFFAMSSPMALAFRATTGDGHRLVTRALRSKVAVFSGNPLVAFALYAVVIPVSHLTIFYNYTVVHSTVRNVEHLLFLIVGYLFWRQIFGVDPNRHRLHPVLQFAYLFLAIPIDTFTGLSLNSTNHEIFPAYAAMHRTYGPSPVQDLHIGGAIMWVGGDSLMLLPMVVVALRLMHLEERRAVRIDRQLDAMLPVDRSAGPSPDRPTPPGLPTGA